MSIRQRENHKVNQTKWPTGIGLALLLLAAGYQFFCALQPIEFLLNHVFLMDDAYYYFNVAQNMSLQGWATFDGIHATSGIQLSIPEERIKENAIAAAPRDSNIVNMTFLTKRSYA